MFSHCPVNCRVYLRTKTDKSRYGYQHGEILPGLYNGCIKPSGEVYLLAPTTEWPIYLSDGDFELYPGV